MTDIKQFTYCPRVVYFTYVMPVERKVSWKMQEGKEQHANIQSKERERGFKVYGLGDEVRGEFGVELKSGRLGLSGILDLLLQDGRSYYPVEYKYSTGDPGLNHRYQLTAYAMLLEDTFGTPVRRGFVHVLGTGKVYPVDITQNMRDFVKKTLKQIRDMITYERLPSPTRYRTRCTDCEYRLFCNDIELEQ